MQLRRHDYSKRLPQGSIEGRGELCRFRNLDLMCEWYANFPDLNLLAFSMHDLDPSRTPMSKLPVTNSEKVGYQFLSLRHRLFANVRRRSDCPYFSGF